MVLSGHAFQPTSIFGGVECFEGAEEGVDMMKHPCDSLQLRTLSARHFRDMLLLEGHV